jgi:hypothetical protein
MSARSCIVLIAAFALAGCWERAPYAYFFNRTGHTIKFREITKNAPEWKEDGTLRDGSSYISLKPNRGQQLTGFRYNYEGHDCYLTFEQIEASKHKDKRLPVVNLMPC